MSIDKYTKGIIADLSNKEYHSNKSHHSSTSLKLSIKDPLLYYETYIEGKPQPINNQDALTLGNYIHTLLLEPEKLSEEYAVFTGPRRAGKEWELFEYNNRHLIIITDSQAQLANKMAVQFSQAKIMMDDGITVNGPQLFTGGLSEESFFTDLDGFLVKCRTDYRICNDAFIIRDLKTTNDTPNTVEVARNICNSFGYGLSAALYVDILKKITGQDYKFELVFISKADFKTNIYRVSENTLAKGRLEYKQAIEQIKEWKRTGVYFKSKIREV